MEVLRLEAVEMIPEMQGEMVELLQKLIRIPSIRSEERIPNAPFGSAVAEALSTVLTWGEKQGFKSKNVQGYAGHLEFGEGDETVGVLVHLDVVPSGEGWNIPPFAGEIRDGKIYGRGTIDDKGPAVAVLFALKAVKDAAVPLKRKIRVILGCDEESRWECMEKYFSVEVKPNFGFTPDAEFPLVYSEKGRLGIRLTGQLNEETNEEIRLTRLQGGTRANVVPEEAEAFIRTKNEEIRASVLKILKEYTMSNSRFQIAEANEQVIVRVSGVAAHASQPELGVNALSLLAAALNQLGLSGGAWDIVKFAAEQVGLDHDGSGFGIDVTDVKSGKLTLNVGVMRVDELKTDIELDIRYPRTVEGEVLLKIIEAQSRSYNLTVSDQTIMPPHFVSPDHPLVKGLLKAYQIQTGDLGPPLAIGGRTYATTLGTAVAFGPVFPGRPELAHQKDEHISIAEFVECAKIYTRALCELAGV
jgi:succinyl-diaminopimelate desuccinylase